MLYQLTLTENCNLKCAYCYEYYKRNQVMNFETGQKVMKFIAEHQKERKEGMDKVHINFNGGEPLLNYSVLQQMLEEFQKLGVRTFSISTNLTLANPDILEYLYNNKVHLHISLDGKKEIHDKNRYFVSGKGSFDTVIANVKYILHTYPDWNNSYNITLPPHNVSVFYETFKFLTDLGIRNITTAYVADRDWTDEDIEVFKQEIAKIGKDYIRYYERGEQLIFKFFDDSISSSLRNQKSICGAYLEELAILSNGDILPCGSFVGLEDVDKFIIGNVEEYLKDRKLKMIIEREKLDVSECESCAFRKRCHVECYATHYRVKGDMYEVLDHNCYINQSLFMEADRIIDYLYKNKVSLFFKNFGLDKMTQGENTNQRGLLCTE